MDYMVSIITKTVVQAHQRNQHLQTCEPVVEHLNNMLTARAVGVATDAAVQTAQISK